MKVGLFGGTFDPVHNAHIAIAEHAIDQFGLDEVWFLADKHPRRKSNFSVYKHRLKMLELATAHNDKLISNNLDHQKLGTNYDSRFFESLLYAHPDHKFYIILGSDTVKYLKHWDNIDIYKKNAVFLIAKRNSETLDIPKDLTHYLISTGTLDISSSQVRSSPHTHKNKLNKNVYYYISKNKLFS